MKRNKFNARKTEVDGHIFDSRAEAQYYVALLNRIHEGEVWNVKLQPVFKFIIDGEPLRGMGGRELHYKGDFLYDTKEGPICVDVKGMILPEFKLKWSLVKHLYPCTEFRIWKNGHYI